MLILACVSSNLIMLGVRRELARLGADEPALAPDEETGCCSTPKGFAPPSWTLQVGLVLTGLAAAIGAMGEYERLSASGDHEALWGRVERLEERIRSVLAAHGIGVHVNRLCSMMQIFLTDLEPAFEAYSRLENRILDLLFLGLINEGVMLTLPTSNHIYFSFMHDETAFDEIADALERVLDRVPLGEAYRQQGQTERQGSA